MELLEAALRDDAPQPDPAFARDLDRRVEGGFPRARRRWRPPLIPALTAAAVLIAIATVGIAVLGDGDTETPITVPEAAPTAARHGADTLAGAAQTARRVERSIRLALATPHGNL